MEYNALFTSGKKDLYMKELTIDETRQKFIRMLRSGVCGTDKHVIKGDLTDVKLPRVLGHENVGEINGERFVWPAIVPCGKCEECKSGRPNRCVKNQVFGLTIEDTRVGGWSEFTPLPEGTLLYKVPDEITDENAVLIETIASTKPLHNIDLKGKSVLIVGSGAIGLVGAIHAKLMGADYLAIVGHSEQTRLLGKLIDKKYEKGTTRETIGEQFDVVYDAGGDPESCAYSVEMVKPFGTVVESLCMPHRFDINLNPVIEKEAKIVTQFGYVPEDFIWAIELMRQSQESFSKVISHRFMLNEADKILDTILNKRYGKIIISPNNR
jgi:threonine dehydrogenase-like Zn-dependent dehydrogenase